ncbi:Integral membrane sensor signal transduction histidine kinase [Planktothrix sp. PCC 11201]|uniref:sensor histidine kinase n=1 Tax=Planktothrix sp. PCC 11201 TaxID=1729650 RepID=UPI00091A39F3|nr:HAMP domain-containing sensor histidine kinase [Planktothrix sp. PCC 11201]SKB11623.1 Integral membrane sensor signal transduction histidine kinase [Planktothrix sp. PCC 11201]
MAWGIDLNRTKYTTSHRLRWQLLLYYLAVMLAILGSSIIAVYEFTYHSLYAQFEHRLEVLAQAASHSLLSIKAEYLQAQENGNPNHILDPDVPRRLDHDQDLDIPWRKLREPNQGVEWFNAQGQLVGNAGTLLWDLPPVPGWQTLEPGNIRLVTLSVYSYPQGKPQLEGYIRTSEDITEVEDLLDRFRWGLLFGGSVILAVTGLGGIWLTRQSLKPIERSLQQLKQFTADASHELRSPLAAIKTSAEVMQYYPERIHPLEMKKVVGIANATKQMTRLVDDLMLLARMDADVITQTQESTVIRLDLLLQDLSSLLEGQAQAKNIDLQFYLLPNVEVRGISEQIHRLFTNLLENSLHYTCEGGQVILSMKKIDHAVAIAITDTGIGIAPEDLKFVFDRFWRADRARSRRVGGTGLGLAIAQTIAQQHRGEITVSSQLGVGSCFQVRLPIV